MELCNRDHEEVCFLSWDCPVCWERDRLNKKLKIVVKALDLAASTYGINYMGIALDKIKED